MASIAMTNLRYNPSDPTYFLEWPLLDRVYVLRQIQYPPASLVRDLWRHLLKFYFPDNADYRSFVVQDDCLHDETPLLYVGGSPHNPGGDVAFLHVSCAGVDESQDRTQAAQAFIETEDRLNERLRKTYLARPDANFPAQRVYGGIVTGMFIHLYAYDPEDGFQTVGLEVEESCPHKTIFHVWKHKIPLSNFLNNLRRKYYEASGICS